MRSIPLAAIVSLALIILNSAKFTAMGMVGVCFWGILFLTIAFRFFTSREVLVVYSVLYFVVPFLIPETMSDPMVTVFFGLVYFSPASLACGYSFAKALRYVESNLDRRQVSKSWKVMLRTFVVCTVSIVAILHARQDFENYEKTVLKNTLMGQYVAIAKMATDFPLKNMRDLFEIRNGALYHAANGLVEYAYNRDERSVTTVFHQVPAGGICYGMIYSNPNIVNTDKSIASFQKFINGHEIVGSQDRKSLQKKCGGDDSNKRVDIKFVVTISDNFHLDLAEAQARGAQRYKDEKERERLVADAIAQRRARYSERIIKRNINPGNYEFERHIFKTGNTLDVPLAKIRELSHDAGLRGLAKKCEWSNIADLCQDLGMEGRVACADRAEEPPLEFEMKDWKRIEHEDFYVVQYGRLMAFWTISCQKAFPEGLKWRKR